MTENEDLSENTTPSTDGVELDPRDAQIAELTVRLKAVSRKYQEQVDEMASFRSRMEARAKADQARRSADVVRTFFEPVQNLARMLDSSGDIESLQNGVRLVHRQFVDALTALGLTPVPGVGTRFNPDLHEAVMLDAVNEPIYDNVVTAVHVAGWMVHDRAIQVAKVSVGRYTPPAGEE